ncbi:MAG: cupin domain-containing protein [Caldilineaceae bacterium]|nr:cupin domain-containing protein [Caldilineaceae bacterium]
MPFFDPAEREPHELFPGILTRTFWGDKILISMLDLAPHGDVPFHSHPHEQAGVVLEGELELTIDGEVRLLGPGQVFVIPGGVEHRARTLDKPAKVIDIFSPVREEYKF